MANRRALALAAICCFSILLFSAGCAPSPNDAQIEAAIRTSLSGEKSPPELDFDGMEVPERSAGKASAVLWTADEELQRNYILEYSREDRAFAVKSFTTGRRSEDGTYRPVPNDPGLVPTELAPRFDFSGDFGQRYMLLYAGEGDDLAALRTAFESSRLTAATAGQLAEFEVCDLGGDVLILLVPRYEGMKIWVNEINRRGDTMYSGEEVARFESAMPVYIYCSFSDKLPEYEIHVSSDGAEEFFLTREALLTSIKKVV